MSKDDKRVKWGTHELEIGSSMTQVEGELAKEKLDEGNKNKILADIERAKEIEDVKKFEEERKAKAKKGASTPQSKKKSSFWAVLFVILLIAAIVFLLNYSGIITLF